MKVKMGGQSLNPDVLFKVSSEPPPDHVHTVSDVLAWQASEHQKMLDEASRLLREQLDAAFSQFVRDQDGGTQH